ncbi:MAG: hypothetical protein EB127_21690, partial [Alphaproteobacteria bacterium]|nr:hypothetical protein [Alphaproteobacteria bacterium]
VEGYNFIEPGKDPIDRNGHGTHVAGTICAINNSQGVVGVSPSTKVMPIKALDDSGMGSNNNIGSAIIWAVDNGADIITMSLGSDYPSVTIERALAYAVSKNVVVFCAAGNSGLKHDIKYPAKYSETISIGAVDKTLNICEFSCSGDSLDFVAPGEDILSTTPGNNYAIMTGTSMAAPFAVGCASLWLSFCRKANKNIQLSQLQIQPLQNQIDLEQRKLKNAQTSLDTLDRFANTSDPKDAVFIRARQKTERQHINTEISDATGKLEILNSKLLPLKTQQAITTSDIGPLKYISELIYGKSASEHFDETVRFVIILIVIVFDPLAIVLLLAGTSGLNIKKIDQPAKRGPGRPKKEKTVEIPENSIINFVMDD